MVHRIYGKGDGGPQDWLQKEIKTLRMAGEGDGGSKDGKNRRPQDGREGILSLRMA